MNKTNRAIAIVGVVFLVLVALYAALSTRGPVQLDSNYRVIMGTFSRAVVIAPDRETAAACIAAASAAQHEVDALMSDYKSDSEISRVNRDAYAEPVAVSEETFDVVQRGIDFSKLSDGAFDITVGPLVDLWRAAGEANEPPTETALAEARGKVGYDKLILDEQARTIRFAVEGMRLDLGGIAKGYAIDRSVDAMRQRGALGGMVDIGGDVRCFGKPPRGQESWRVALQDPNVAPDEWGDSEPVLVLEVQNEAVTTSGDYRRFVVIGDEKENHIVDTHTGHGARQLTSVTIIAPDATTADALATAVSVLGAEKGLALIERLSDAEAVLIPGGSGGKLSYSAGAAAYVR